MDGWMDGWMDAWMHGWPSKEEGMADGCPICEPNEPVFEASHRILIHQQAVAVVASHCQAMVVLAPGRRLPRELHIHPVLVVPFLLQTLGDEPEISRWDKHHAIRESGGRSGVMRYQLLLLIFPHWGE